MWSLKAAISFCVTGPSKPSIINSERAEPSSRMLSRQRRRFICGIVPGLRKEYSDITYVRMKSAILVILLLASIASASQHVVSSAKEIALTMKSAAAGDVLVMRDGEWKDQ